MSNKKRMPLVLALLVGSILVMQPGGAEAQKGDAVRAADFAARTAVQTIYHNLVTQGYEWRWIRDEKMPDILLRAVRAIDQHSKTMDKRLLLRTFIPTYVSAYYDEIAKINKEHRQDCLDVVFVVRTMIPFLDACQRKLAHVGTLVEIAEPILKAQFAFKVCQTLSACQQQLGDRYFVVFGQRMPADNFYSVCVGDAY